ncbi:MAG: glycosyltransferase family 4 protein, partial [Bacteroidia bacterium]
MKIFAYTQHYAQKTTTFMTNELMGLDRTHELLLAYSVRLHPALYNLKHMVQIPYAFNKVSNKIRWWLEQSQTWYSLFNLSFSKKLNAEISAFKPEIIHCHFGTDFLKVFANLEKKHSDIPFLISFYGFDVTEKIRNKAILKRYRQFLSRSNIHSVAVSASLAKNINEVIQPKNKAIVLHSGTNTDFFTRLNYSPEPGVYTFLQVSSFLQKKGHKHTLKAFRKFIDQDKRYYYKFILAGLGPLQDEVLNYIKELGLSEHVSFIGTISPAEMVEVGSRANCFVQMSITADNGDQ